MKFPSVLPFFLLALFLASPALAVIPKVTWHEILTTPEKREGLFQDADSFAGVIPPRFAPKEGVRPFTEVLAAVYETFENPPETHYFFCTVYYTPQETGFTELRGFNTAPDSLKSLRSHKFGTDFLKATYIEGFGRMAKPVDGRPYLAYNGRFHSRILGNRNNTLKPRESIAVHRRNPLFSAGRRVWILDHELYNELGAVRMEVADTGGGLFRSQIDVYWGEDDPLGPGGDVFRPASCDVAVRWIVPVLIWR